MCRNILTFGTLFSFLIFIISCSTIRTTSTKDFPISPTSEIQAKEFPEVFLTKFGEDTYKGKFLSLIGEDLVFLPFPYWNVETLKINLNNIHSIQLVKKNSPGLLGFASGFAYSFIIFGIIGASGAKYDRDYEEALVRSFNIGLTGALLGLAIAGAKSEYKFYKMSESEKISAARKIMGY